MTDRALDELATTACNPEVAVTELRRIALVAIGELSMLRKEHAQLREQTTVPAAAWVLCPNCETGFVNHFNKAAA